jgi:hypothetical protein
MHISLVPYLPRGQEGEAGNGLAVFRVGDHVKTTNLEGFSLLKSEIRTVN